MRFHHYLAALGLFVSLPAVSAHADTLLVPGHYAAIQSAVNHAHPGDTVLVTGGVYHENVVIATRNITLAGLNGATLDGTRTASSATDPGTGRAFGQDGIAVNAAGVTVRGLTVQNYDFEIDFGGGVPGLTAGISVNGDHATIQGNLLQKNAFGLHLLAGTTCASLNALTANRVEGAFFESGRAIFETNLLSHNGQIVTQVFDGTTYTTPFGTAMVVWTDGNTIRYNSVVNNVNDGVFFSVGIPAQYGGPLLLTNTFASNLISNNHGIGINLDSCENVNVTANLLTGNGQGIYVTDATDSCTLDSNQVYGSTYDGLLLNYAYGNTIKGNIAYGNATSGMGYDAEDDNGSGANTYIHNHFGTTSGI